jgi:hypothetical protein
VVRKVSLKTFDVTVQHHLTREHLIVHARSADEAMNQALVILSEIYRSFNDLDVDELICLERKPQLTWRKHES